jgi:hypothetical protein
MDRYKKLGKKTEITGPEEALLRAREYWPNVFQEGSTGPERTWWSRIGDETALVAHHWQDYRSGKWYMRRAVDMNTIMWGDDYHNG